MIERKKRFLIAAAIIVVGSGAYWTGNFVGYKTGQIDYARGKVEYDIIAEHVVHIMGKAPLPEVELKPIDK